MEMYARAAAHSMEGDNMAKVQTIFKRYEKKYLLNEEQYSALTAVIDNYMKVDQYGRHTICNIYYDTPDFYLIRKSIDKPVYKEKLRLRSYGIPDKDSKVFVELKKKYNGVVYKRRITMSLKDAYRYLSLGITTDTSQIKKEIDYFMSYYHPIPQMYIAYDRIAYFSESDPDFRITFDSDIRYRNDDLYLENGDYGEYLLEKGCHLMELKIAGAIPLWLTHALTELKIYPASFSKYGNIYKTQFVNGGIENYVRKYS